MARSRRRRIVQSNEEYLSEEQIEEENTLPQLATPSEQETVCDDSGEGNEDIDDDFDINDGEGNEDTNDDVDIDDEGNEDTDVDINVRACRFRRCEGSRVHRKCSRRLIEDRILQVEDKLRRGRRLAYTPVELPVGVEPELR